MASEISVSERQASLFANSIYRAITQDLPDMISEYHLHTSVGAGQFRYNFINRNLSALFDEGFDIYYVKRGFWTFIVLYSSTLQLSFSVMSEQNLARLQHHLPSKAHYLEALVLNNEKREPLTRQLSLFETKVDRDFDELEELRQKLLVQIDGVIKEHVLVVFDAGYAGVTSCRAVLLTPDLEIAISEDWSQYLKEHVIPESTILSKLLEDDDEISLVNLKSEISKELEENFIVSEIEEKDNDRIE